MVRRAEDADLTALSSLYRAWDDEGHDEPAEFDPSFEERFRAWYAGESSRRVIWLAEADGRPVGFVDLAILVRRPVPGRAAVRWAYLDNAFVLDAYRNRGIGTMLLDAVLGYAAHHDVVQIMLHPTANSVPFYQRAGFDIMPPETKPRMIRAVG